MNNQDNEKVFQKSQINCLRCIYTVHRLNPYKMGLFSKWDLASFSKKTRNN